LIYLILLPYKTLQVATILFEAQSFTMILIQKFYPNYASLCYLIR